LLTIITIVADLSHSAFTFVVSIGTDIFLLMIKFIAFSAIAFSALTLLVGRQEGHPACKKT